MNANTAAPRTVSVILPTYNRAAFLPDAFASVMAQQYGDWELIVVDDGSTDDTERVVASYAPQLGDRLRYVRQPNGGAYAARNRGLDEAGGRYMAFFDSDDLWLPHHLQQCVTALDAHADVDWVFAACRQVDHTTGTTLEPSTFRVAGTPRPFLRLNCRADGALRIIDDEGVVECQILHGLFCGLQNSVIRRRLFDGRRFDPRSKVVDDEMFVIRVLAAGARFAYFDDVHVVYRVHDDNSSGSATAQSTERRVRLFTEMTDSLEQLLRELPLGPRERRALRKRLGREYFWHLGYGALWTAGERDRARQTFSRGLAAWPWDLAAWKTYVLAAVRR